MTLPELRTITGFSADERDYVGRLVSWPDYWFHTMEYLSRLRSWVGSSCLLIRGDHNIGSGKPPTQDKRTAIDACFPKVPYGRVMMEIMRLPCSWGVYVGRNIHLDLRQTEKPARWMAFKPTHRSLLTNLRLSHLITGENDGWLYVQWSHVQSVRALYLLQQIADDEQPDVLLNPMSVDV